MHSNADNAYANQGIRADLFITLTRPLQANPFNPHAVDLNHSGLISWANTSDLTLLIRILKACVNPSEGVA